MVTHRHNYESRYKLVYDPRSKLNPDPHTLVFTEIPPLIVGDKPIKDDRDSSIGASSPMPPDVPSTPVKGARKQPTPKVRELPLPSYPHFSRNL